MSRVWGMGGELGVSASRPSSDLSKSPCPRKLAGRSAWPVHSCRCEEAPLTRAAQRRSVRQRPRKEAERLLRPALPAAGPTCRPLGLGSGKEAGRPMHTRKQLL